MMTKTKTMSMEPSGCVGRGCRSTSGRGCSSTEEGVGYCQGAARVKQSYQWFWAGLWGLCGSGLPKSHFRN